MKVWISFSQSTEGHGAYHKETNLFVGGEPRWVESERYVGGGYWVVDHGEDHSPCWMFLMAILEPQMRLPTKPTELLELEVEVTERWEIK